MDLQPVARQSVSDAVYGQLLAQVLSGALAPGDALPAERVLTETFGVNRQAVREALKRLDQAGLVEITHGGATRVRDHRTSAGLDLLPVLLLRPEGSIDVEVARAVMEMRACIGPDAARLCAQRAPVPLVDQLRSVTEAMAAVADDVSALATLDWRYWELVIDGADNIAYRLAFNSLRDGAQPLAMTYTELLLDELTDIATHRALTDAVAAGDGGAAEAAARTLLERGYATAMALAAGQPPRPTGRTPRRTPRYPTRPTPRGTR